MGTTSDTLDAEATARSVLAGQSPATPKTADGAVEMRTLSMLIQEPVEIVQAAVIRLCWSPSEVYCGFTSWSMRGFTMYQAPTVTGSSCTPLGIWSDCSACHALDPQGSR